jgi:hypothetical protein
MHAIEIRILPELAKIVEASPTGDLNGVSRSRRMDSADGFATVATRQGFPNAAPMGSARPAQPSWRNVAPLTGS